MSSLTTTQERSQTKASPLPQLNIDIGTQFLLEFKGIENRIKSVFIGMEPSRHLIVSVPNYAEYKSKLTEGNYTVIRFVSLGNVRGFRTRILGTVTAPTPLVFLDYPHTIEAVNLRKEKRVRCYIPAAAQKSNTLTKGLLTDINLTGCRFNYHHAGDAAQDLSIDTDLLRLSSPLLGIGETLQCSGTVRNLTHTHNTASAGIQFQDIPTEVVEKIRVYMQNVSEHEGEDAQNV